MLFVLRGFRIALLADDGFSKLLAAGLTFGFALQTFIIVGGVLRVIPLTGITLPFVSYGGSSIVANFILLAGLLLVSNRANAHDERTRMNRQITRLAVAASALLVGARRRDDLLADLGGRRPRRPAGQRDPAGRPVHDQARADLRRRRQRCSPRNARRKVGGRTFYFRSYPQRTDWRRTSSATRRSRARAPGSSAR